MLTVIPAYGRDYNSIDEIQKDYDAGKDFLISDISSRYDGSYINKEQAVEMGIKLIVRYSKKRKSAVIG
jgi:hypothetical protein